MYRGFDVPALGANSGNEERHFTGQGANTSDLSRESSADHQRALAAGIPFGAYQPGDPFVKLFAADIEELQITATGIRGTAEENDALVRVGQVGINRIATQVRIDGDGVGMETLESFDRVLLGGAADVATLGVENHRRRRMSGMNVSNQCFELIFGAVGGEVGNLWLEAADEICRRVDNGSAEFENCVGSVFQMRRESFRIGIQADAEQAVAVVPGRVEGMDEVHRGFNQSQRRYSSGFLSGGVTLKKLEHEDYLVMRAAATVIEADGFGEKVLCLSDGTMLKLFRRKRFFSSAAWYPYAQRFADNAAALCKRGVPVPGIIEVMRIPAIARDAVHYHPLPGKTLRELCREGLAAETEQELKAGFTRFVIRLHDCGVYFRSLHLGNVVYTTDHRFGLIDISDARIRGGRLSKHQRARNLRRLQGIAGECEWVDFSTVVNARRAALASSPASENRGKVPGRVGSNER